MDCARYRAAASARLDNEPLGMSASALEHHLATCPACTGWLEHATRIGRSLRLSGDTPPDLSGRILAGLRLPDARITRYRRLLRIGLALLGVLQWALAAPALLGQQMYTSMSMHASHESAAWNLAIGAAFLAVAVRPSQAAGAVPIMATFVGVLALLSLPDLADGSAGGARLSSHAAVVAGLLLLLLVQRSERLDPGRRSVQVPVDAPGVWETPHEHRSSDRRGHGAA